ncbi:tyrosine-type recombinase/integrase [Haladaptatus caseinilyticus]|uniref:tyrosine-type recombinase/integrase n=1 Tax=Haladaptatus caseinilyticus TaxID=2993314 RepID=UPI00224B5719|nr:site-specific integrase [Haladaptatus caseinilyticus]
MNAQTPANGVQHEVPIRQAFTDFIRDMESQMAYATVMNKKNVCRQFTEWVEDLEDCTLATLSGYHLGQFSAYLRDDKDLKDITRKQYLCEVRTFLTWCENKEIARTGISDRIELPQLTKDDIRSDAKIKPDRVRSVLAYLDKYRHARKEHVWIHLLFKTGARMSAIRHLDLRHVHLDRGRPYLELTHRPEKGMPLKNGNKDAKNAERPILISEDTATLLREYIQHNRHNVTETIEKEDGQTVELNPLLTTRYGRWSHSSTQDVVYQWTCPAATGGECEVHGTEIPSRDDAHDCRKYEGHSVSPHKLRAASIVHHRNRGISVETVSEKMNVSIPVIKTHYDKPSTSDRLDRQAGIIDKL